MKVIVIDRARQRADWGHGCRGIHAYIVTVEIADTCPACGGPRGEPRFNRYHEDGDWYSVSNWDNPCGHLDKYADVLAEAVAS